MAHKSGATNETITAVGSMRRNMQNFFNQFLYTEYSCLDILTILKNHPDRYDDSGKHISVTTKCTLIDELYAFITSCSCFMEAASHA